MKNTLLLLLFSLLVVSCGEDEESSVSSSPTTSSNIVASIDKSVGSMNIFGSSSTSTVLSSFDIESLLSPSSCYPLGDDDGPSDIDYKCSSTGSPLKSANGDENYCEYSASDTTYIAEIFYCSVIFNTASPDSLRGALTLANLIECTLRNQEFFDFSEGDENSGSATIDLTTSNSCFSEFTYTDPEPDAGASTDIGAFISGKLRRDMPDSFSIDAVVTQLSSGDWDYNVELSASVDGDEISMNLKLKSSDDIVAASMADNNEVWSVTVDQGSGVLSFETVDKTNNRRRRTMVSGTFDDQGELDLSENVTLKAWVLEQCTSSNEDCDVDGGSVGWNQFVSADGIYIGATKKTYLKQTEYIKTTEGVSTTVSGVCSSGTSTDCDSYDGIGGKQRSKLFMRQQRQHSHL